MTIPDIEARLRHALAVAAPSRSIADDVIRQLPASPPRPVPRLRWRRSILVTTLVAPALLVGLLALFFVTNGAVRLTLADVKAVVARQAWDHIRYDVGPEQESWTNLRTGEQFIVGSLLADPKAKYVIYLDRAANTRLWYWKASGLIQQDAPLRPLPAKGPQPWTPESAWQYVVAPLEREVDATKQAKSAPASITSAYDMLNGKPAIRFDSYSIDSLGNRFLYQQLWADPSTHLPLRVRTRLQLAYREKTGKEWSTGDYDFPATGPANLYALGVPRGTPIVKSVATAPKTVEPVLKGIDQASRQFLQRYRAIVWAVRDGSRGTVEQFDLIWRDGDRLRQDHHLPQFEAQETHVSLPLPNPVDLLAWAAKTAPSQMQLVNGGREYIWTSAAVGHTPKARVQVMTHGKIPLLATGCWPEQIQWPTRFFNPDFQLLPANPETPPGCIGLRQGGQGDFRSDYYVDPANDSICINETDWTKRGGKWAKSREYTLSDLHRVAGRVVAGKQQIHDYGDPAQHTVASSQMTKIEIVPLKANEFPPGIFDPASLTRGAEVSGY